MRYLQAAGTVLILAAVHRLYMHDLVGMFLIGIAAHQCFIHQKIIDFYNEVPETGPQSGR